MSKLEKYTTVELINKFKNAIGDDIEGFLCKVISSPNSIRNLKEMINREVEKYFELLPKSKIDEEKVRKIRITKTYELAYEILQQHNEEYIKMQLLSELYMAYSDRLNISQKRELKALILDGNNIYVYEYPSDKYEGVNNYKVFTKEKEESLGIFTNDPNIELLYYALSAVEMPELKGILKEQYSQTIYSVILSQIGREYLLDNNIVTLEQYKEGLKGNIEAVKFDFEQLGKIDDFMKLVREYLCENFQFVDKEKLLLNLASKVMLGIKIRKGKTYENVTTTEVDKKKSKEALATSIAILKRVAKELKNSKYEGKSYNLLTADEKLISITTLKDIEEFLTRCTDTDYITDEDIIDIHSNLSNGDLPYDMKQMDIANVTADNVVTIIENYEKEEDVHKKQKLLNAATDTMGYLLQREKIDEKRIFEMYLEGSLNIELLNTLKMDKISEKIYNQKMQQIFGEYIISGGIEEKQIQFNRFAKLYKSMQEKGHVKTTPDELIESLTSLFSEDYMEDTITELYDNELINERKYIEWLGTYALIDLYQKGKFQPAQIKIYNDEGLISLEQIIKMIKSLSDNSEKWFVIGSIFSGNTEEDRAKRELLTEECFKIESGEKRKPGNKREDGKPTDKNQYNKYITDPYARMELIKKLDPKFISQLLPDGHWLVTLPNLQKVIIEKVLDKDRNPSYGASTFIIDKDHFDIHDIRYIREGKVMRTKILKDIETGKVAKINHFRDSWGRKIKEHFGIKEGSKWSKEDLEDIDAAIERIKESSKIKEG